MGKILVTGGMGYIGSHTIAALIENGYRTVSIDNFSNSKPEILPKLERLTQSDIEFFETDTRNESALEKIFSCNDIDTVIHFAGLKSVSQSVADPMLYYSNNVGGIISLINAMEHAGCKNLVFSSSATVYGINNPVPNLEDMPVSAVTPYGQTKLMTEQILSDLCNSDPKWSVLSLRYFNPIGAHPSGFIGEELSDNPPNIAPYIMKVALGELPYVRIFGNDYPTADGTGIRDYIHISDLAEGHISAVDYVRSHKGFDIINLGTGHGYSVLELIHTFEEVCGKKIPWKFVSKRMGDVGISYADISKAKKLLNWSPRLDLYDMCRDNWNFIMQKQREII